MVSRNFLRVLVEGGASVSLDIVAVHGLNPRNTENHAEDTWTASNGSMWLRDFLPQNLPNARILLFGYNASVGSEASFAGVNEQAENLLNRLQLDAKRKISKKRPIVFICHSLGGLIVKQALITAKINDRYESVRTSTRGIVFFGTPHQGELGRLRDFIASTAQLFLRAPTNTFVEALKAGTIFSDSIIQNFRHQREDYKVVSFYETIPIKGDRKLIVDQKSATLGLPGDREVQIGLDADHLNMCKFHDIKGDDYEQVASNISFLAEEVLKDVPARDNILNSTGEERNKCIQALNAPDYLGFRSRKVGDAVGDTFQWFLDQEVFVSWRSAECPSVLWIKGSPAKGKTVLLKLLLGNLEYNTPLISTQNLRLLENRKVIYFFFYGQEPELRTVSSLLRSLIVQLLKSSDIAIFRHILPIFREEGVRFTSSNESLWIILKDIISDPIFNSIYCVIDALDECEESDSEDLLSRLQELFSAMRFGSSHISRPLLKLLVTSRPNDNIAAVFRDFPFIDLKSNSKHLANDLNKYIESKLGSIPLSALPDRFRDKVRAELQNRAGGTFLWVSFVIRRLKGIKFPSESKVQAVINGLPDDLESMYQALIDPMLKSSDKTYSKLLAWIVYAGRPLTLLELEEALATQLCSKERREIAQYRPVISETAVAECSGGLLEVIDGTACFIHQSVKDFIIDKGLLSTISFSGISSPTLYLAKVCMTYLNFEDFGSYFYGIQGSYTRSETQQHFPLLEYAGLFWFTHITSEEEVPEIMDLLCPLLGYRTGTLCTWLGVHYVERHLSSGVMKDVLSGVYDSPFGIAITFDILWLASYILGDNNTKLSKRIPSDIFRAAICKPSDGAMLFLLEHPSCQGIEFDKSVVEAAVRMGPYMMESLLKKNPNIEVPKTALALGIKLDSINKQFIKQLKSVKVTRRVLTTAVRKGDFDLVQLLLEKAKSIRINEIVLKYAVYFSRDGGKILELLLDANGNRKITEAVLVRAARHQDLEFLRCLLGRTKDFEITSKLVKAAARNKNSSKEILRWLLGCGRDVNINEEILIAIIGNRETSGKALEMLFDTGQDITITRNFLIAAAANKNAIGTLQLLSKHNKGVKIAEGLVTTCNIEITERVLIAAAANEHAIRIFTLLLGQNPEVRITEGILIAAAANKTFRNTSILKFLLQYMQGAKITEEVVVAAAENPKHRGKMVEILFEEDSNIQVTGRVLDAMIKDNGLEEQEILLILIKYRNRRLETTKDTMVTVAAVGLEIPAPPFLMVLDNRVQYFLCFASSIAYACSYGAWNWMQGS